MSDELLELALRIEAASGPDRALDALAAVACGLATAVHPTNPERCAWHDGMGLFTAAPAYTASLDAAITLVPDDLRTGIVQKPDRSWSCALLTVGNDNRDCPEAEAKTAPLAITAAALRARASHLRMEVE